MDLVGYDEQVFTKIESDFRQFLSRFQSLQPYFIPISALVGDNIVKPSENMPWFSGHTLLEHLETVPVGKNVQRAAFRFPVQRVVRPNHSFRGYAGTVASGHIRTGDPIVVLPSGRRSTVSSITTFDGDLDSVHPGQSVTLTLTDELDISRGDVIVSTDQPPQSASSIDAIVVWLNETPGEAHKRYRLKGAARLENAELASIHHRVNINTLEHEPAQSLEMNAVGHVRIEVARPLVFDSYSQNRITGSFILIDPVTNATVAAGMITGAAADGRHKEAHAVTLQERIARQRHSGAIVRLGTRFNVALRLERLVFAQGGTVFAFESLPEEASRQLLATGAIVILNDAVEPDVSIETMDGRKTATSPLPEDDREAAVAIELLLERLQVLSPPATFTDSDGI
jgi:sulfate adenylyltransferase subunit 1 (EFTu-like GTPase family)